MPRRAKIRPDEPGQARIFDAGRALFGRRSFEGVSIAEIGREAGIAKSVLYHHFGSKAELYRAILEEDGRGLVDAVSHAVPPDRRVTPRLRPGVDAFLRYLSEHPDTWRLATREPPSDPELREIHDRVTASVSRSLRDLLAVPEKEAARPDLVELVALTIRTFASWWYEHPDVPREEVLEAILDVAAAAAHRIQGLAEEHA